MDETIRIDRYLSGAMSSSERQAFEQELTTNAELREQVQLQRSMQQFLQHKEERQELQQKLTQTGGDFFQIRQARPRLWVRWAAGSAAAAAVVLLVVWQFLLQPSLYDTYADFPPLTLTEKSADTPVDWSQTEAAFNGGDYATAAEQLAQYLQTYPDDQQAQLYLGIARMELGQAEEANELFRQLADASADIRPYAIWYRALNYLKADKKDNCRAVLEAIPQASPFYEEAQELLGKL